jgi:hypothetical protein
MERDCVAVFPMVRRQAQQRYVRNCWSRAREDGTSVSHPHSAAFVAANDTPLIDERAATRGRTAMGGGDEDAGVKRAAIRSISSLARLTARSHSKP